MQRHQVDLDLLRALRAPPRCDDLAVAHDGGEEHPVAAGDDHGGVRTGQRRAPVGVAEQVLVEARQQAHAPAAAGSETGAEVIARTVQLELVELLACGGDPGARIGEGQR